MSQTLYALLVGINDYPEPIPKLTGCVNDVEAFATFLKERIASDSLEVNPLKLTNEEATREAIITSFRQHLGQATQDDFVFFAYSGHGSQEKAPLELWPDEPDRLHETLVCWDSRCEGSRDLADKELAKLIAEVSENNPRITVSLDCCHSGSGTRLFNVRYVEPDVRQRPIDSYLFSLADLQSPSPTRELGDNSLKGAPFRGRHVLLAACRDRETAKEYREKQRGAFSYFLLETLQQASGSLTYRDAFRRTNALIRAQVPQQSPQLEATHEEDLNLYFLSGQRQASTPYFTMAYDSTLGWTIDGGSVHGMVEGSEEARPQLAIFPFDTPLEEMKTSEQAVGLAEVVEVLPHASRIALAEGTESIALKHGEVFKAIVTRLPLVRFSVFLDGEEPGLDLVRQALLTAGPDHQPSLYVKLADSPTSASFRVAVQDGAYQITELTSFQRLAGPLPGSMDGSASQVVRRLEHMARWRTLVQLSGPKTSQIPPNAVKLQIYQDEQAIQSGQIEFRYQKKQGRWHQPQFRLQLTNTWERPLYCSVLNLTERYAVNPVFFEAGGVWLEPGESVWANEGKVFYSSVPKALWLQGVTEYRDIYKLIVSTAEFDARLLAQSNLDEPATRSVGIELSQLRPSVLNRLMRRLYTRDVASTPEEEEFYDDWSTHQVLVTTIRPLN